MTSRIKRLVKYFESISQTNTALSPQISKRPHSTDEFDRLKKQRKNHTDQTEEESDTSLSSISLYPLEPSASAPSASSGSNSSSSESSTSEPPTSTTTQPKISSPLSSSVPVSWLSPRTNSFYQSKNSFQRVETVRELIRTEASYFESLQTMKKVTPNAIPTTPTVHWNHSLIIHPSILSFYESN